MVFTRTIRGLTVLASLSSAVAAISQTSPPASTPSTSASVGHPKDAQKPGASGKPLAPAAAPNKAPPSEKPAQKPATTEKSAAPDKSAGAPAAPPNASPPSKPAAASPASGPPAPGAKPPEAATPAFVKPNRPLAAITAVTFSPDGKKLAVGTYGEAVVFDTGTWQQIAQYRQVDDSVRTLAFNQDNQTLAVGSGFPGRTGQTVLWDTTGVKPPRMLPAQYDSIESVAFEKSGKSLLVGADDNKVRYLADIAAGPGTVLDSHNGRVQAVAFSPKENSIFVSGGMDKIVKVWDLKSVKNVVNFDQSDAGITGLTFLNNGDQFVGSSLDGRLYWWGVGYDAKKAAYNGYHFRTVGAHEGGVYTLSRAASGNRMITGGADHVVCIWDINSGGKIREFKDATTQPIYAAALSPDGKIAAAGGRDGLLYILDIDANKPVTTLVPPALPAPPPIKAAPVTASAGKSARKRHK